MRASHCDAARRRAPLTLLVVASAWGATPLLDHARAEHQPGGGDGPVADPAIAYIADYGFARGSFREDLMVANADGTYRTAIWSRTHRSESDLLDYPAWSPDLDGNASNGFQGTIAVRGRDPARAAYVLFLTDVAAGGGVPQGTNIREALATDLDPVTGGFITSPEWSPDLDPAVPGYQGKIAYVGASGAAVIAMSWDGATVRPTHGPSSSVLLYAPMVGYSVTWSPDGARLALDGPGDTILVLDASTGLVTSTLSGFGSNPMDLQWSRTGSRIVYRAYTGGEQQQTIDVGLGVGSIRQVTNEACTTNTAGWSPDDRALVYMRFCDYSIRRVDLSTGLTTTLIPKPSKATLWRPDWRRF